MELDTSGEEYSDMLEGLELAKRIAELAWKYKGEDITVLNVSELTEFTDYFVLIAAEVDQHLRAITDSVVDDLKREGVRPHHVEGVGEMRWILVDYFDVVVHLMLPEVRQFYELGALWGHAEEIKIDYDINNQELETGRE